MNFESIKAALPEEALLQIEDLPYPKIDSGKVREIYDLGDNILIIASDRISAFDVVLPNGIPGKGILLTQISQFWFSQTESISPNHLVPDQEVALAEVLKGNEQLIPRSMLVRKLNPLPVEAVVRGYLVGSGWKDYQNTGKLFGQEVPLNLIESDRLPEPMFTPTTKAKTGHDMPLSLEECETLIGSDLYKQCLDISFKLFSLGSQMAQKAGIILADTKFEFGTDADGNLFLIDEVLTPDSSRYWPADDYVPGRAQHAFDKQYVRDYLETLDWDKSYPGPVLPRDIVTITRDRYLSALELLMSQD